ncbi:MAG TPA: carboxypeptidase-like regulatory domain-containing protein [Pyrinomonadaceae bacterium]|nr:carboxypeptidase-like regulatory domain-containing protein [Pyrinomonadaceae bacterium]
MSIRNNSTFSLVIRAALLLVSLMCADASAQVYSATGRVIDAITAQPIARVRFVYGQPANSIDNGGFVNFKIGLTNSTGEFMLQHLKPGHYALYISASLDRSDLYSNVLSFDVVDADIANLEVQARHGSRLSGFVVPAGVTSATALAGLSSVKVVAAVPSIGNLRVGIANVTNIGPDGSFQFTGLRPGKALINLKADNETLNGLSILRIERNGEELKQGIEIKPGEDILDLRVMIADGTGVIRGQVKVEGGTLPAGARITASISNKLHFANGYAQVDQDGRFVISGLAAGTYELALNIFRPPPRQTRLLPTMKQTVIVTDANESTVIFTPVLANQ